MRITVLIFLSLSSVSAFAQKKVSTINLSSNVAYAAVDRPGDLYVIMTNGEALKFDKSGNEIGKKKFPTVPTIFDPKDGTRAFAYFRDRQAIESIAPDLSFCDLAPLHPEFAVSAWLVCPSKNEFWILDSADLSLKKTKERGTAIAYEANFTGKSPTYMREYLNFLFVLYDQSGIHVLNNLGKEISKINEKVSYFSFLGEEIYYLKDTSVELFDLYTSEKRQVALPHKAHFVLLTDERMMILNEKSVELFEFTP